MSELRTKIVFQCEKLCSLGALFMVSLSLLLVCSVLAEQPTFPSPERSRLAYTGPFRFTSPIIIQVEVRDIEKYGDSERSTRIDDLTTASLPPQQVNNRGGIRSRIYEPKALAPFRAPRQYRPDIDRGRANRTPSHTQSPTYDFRPVATAKSDELTDGSRLSRTRSEFKRHTDAIGTPERAGGGTRSDAQTTDRSGNRPRGREARPSLLDQSRPIAASRSDFNNAAEDVISLPAKKPHPHARVRVIPSQRSTRRRVARRRPPARRVVRPVRRRQLLKKKKPPMTWVESIHAD